MVLTLEGFPQSRLIPGIGVQINYASGPVSTPSPNREAVYVGPMSSGATAVANQVYKIKSSDQANIFGRRSRVARALRKHFRVNPNSTVYAIGYTLVPGTAPTGTITITGTATDKGILSADFAGVTIQAGYKAGDTPTVMAAALLANLNGNLDIPVTFGAVAGVVTATHVHSCASATGDVRFRASASAGTGVTVATSGATVGTGTGTAGVDGASSEISLFQAALDTLATRGIYYIGPLLTTAASLTAGLSHVNLKNTAGVGKRCVAVYATTGLVGASNTLALGVNKEILSLIVQTNGELDIAELVAASVAARQKMENSEPFNMANMSGLRMPEIKGVYADGDRYDDDELQSLLQNGCTPIQTDDIGTYFVKYVTTKSKNQAGTVDDQRAADIHKISVCHNYADRLSSRWAVKYAGFYLRQDKKLPNGTIDFSQKITKKVLQPSLLRQDMKSFTQEYADVLQDVTASKDSIWTDISDQNNSRIEATINLAVVNLAGQFGVEINEVGA